MRAHRQLWQWVAACAVAEAVGMTAAAGAARVADQFTGGGATEDRAAAVSLVVAGGLVEGVALGSAQSRVLARLLPRLRRAPYLLATVAVAGLGWAAGSVPQPLGDTNAAAPPLGLVVLGGAGIGVVTGPVLGSAQALTLRGAVSDPCRWVLANLLAWPGAMAVIFLGAAAIGQGWSLPAVMATGTLTGLAAGAVLGGVTGCFLPGRPGGMHVTTHALGRTMGEQLKRG